MSETPKPPAEVAAAIEALIDESAIPGRCIFLRETLWRLLWREEPMIARASEILVTYDEQLREFDAWLHFTSLERPYAAISIPLAYAFPEEPSRQEPYLKQVVYALLTMLVGWIPGEPPIDPEAL